MAGRSGREVSPAMGEGGMTVKKKAARKPKGPPNCRRCGGPVVLVPYGGKFFYACIKQCEDQVFDTPEEALAQWTKWEGDKVRNQEYRTMKIQIAACVQWLRYLGACRVCRFRIGHRGDCNCKRLYPRDYMRTMQARGMMLGKPKVGKSARVTGDFPALIEEG